MQKHLPPLGVRQAARLVSVVWGIFGLWWQFLLFPTVFLFVPVFLIGGRLPRIFRCIAVPGKSEAKGDNDVGGCAN